MNPKHRNINTRYWSDREVKTAAALLTSDTIDQELITLNDRAAAVNLSVYRYGGAYMICPSGKARTKSRLVGTLSEAQSVVQKAEGSTSPVGRGSRRAPTKASPTSALCPIS